MIINFQINKNITLDQLWNQSEYLNALDLSSENDRAFILISAVALEDQIYKILKSLLPLIKCLEDNKEFTFSFKINLLKSFDLYNPRVFDFLHLIRKIRNNFAHDLTISEFENLQSVMISQIDQCLKKIESQRIFSSVRDKIEAIVNWLFWELICLIPYASELREIMTSEQTTTRLNNLEQKY